MLPRALPPHPNHALSPAPGALRPGQEGEEEAGGAQGVARAEEAGKAGADEPATEEGPRSIL